MRHDTVGWHLIGHSLVARRKPLAGLAAWSALEALPATVTGLLLAKAIDTGFLRGDIRTGLLYLSGLLLAYALGGIATRFTFPMIGSIVEPLRDELMHAVVAGIVRGSDGVIADGATISRITQQVESVRRSVAALLNGLRRFAFTIVAAAIGLSALAGEIVWLILPPVLVSALLFTALLRRLARRQRATIEANERVAREASAAIGGHRDIAAFGRQDEVVDGVHLALSAERAAQQRLAGATATRSLITAIGGQLPLLALLLAAPWLIDRGMSAGVLVGAATYLSAHLEPAMRMLTELVGGSGLQLAVTIRRLAALDHAPAPAQAGEPVTPRGNRVMVDDIWFSYGADAEPVLRELSFAVPEDGHLAIVGPSGIGKSTLAMLLAGLALPCRGEVTVGAVRPDGIAAHHRREHIVLVPQESYVFRATVADNLRYLAPESNEHELVTAAELVGADELITRLGGLRAQLDPATLSAGEKQLIGLARAYASRARVVILDEASCHLDPAAEAHAERAFRDRPGTLIVIAHRAASALRADHILLLDGTRAFFGDHDHLLTSCALYAELVAPAGQRGSGHGGSAVPHEPVCR
ncbi:ATP-binding cassette domain-containing protein [Nonomuraea sp. NPDC050547]|uniref:ATP-binding cassette domain-containing protein n=1 Tax=Nonomuraea sp. NPDC050547 TaxID=3364368 RepID=UPI00379EAA34